MALAVDAASSSEATSATSLTWSHTVSGTNRLLVVGVQFYKNVNSFISGITYNSVALTPVTGAAINTSNYYVDLWYLIAPSTGSNNIVVSYGGGAPFETGCGAVSFTDAHQTVPYGAAVTATGNSSSPSVTVSSGTGEFVMDTMSIIHNGTLSVGAGQTARWNDIGASGFTKYAGSTEPGDASIVMNWSNTTAQEWAITAVNIRPTAAVSSSTGSKLLLLGVG